MMPVLGWLVIAAAVAVLVWYAALNGIAWLLLAAGGLLLLVAAVCGWAIWYGIQSARGGDQA